MTDLKKIVTRRGCRPAEHGRRLVVALEPGDVLAIRPERTRRWFRLPLEAVYFAAVRAEVSAAKRAGSGAGGRQGGRRTRRGLLTTEG